MNAISKSANYHLRKIANIRKYCSKRITRKLINAHILYRINYCGSHFSDTNSTDIKKSVRIIRTSIRLIYNINHSDHMLTYMYQYNLKWLSLRTRCKHRLLCLAHTHTHKTLLISKPGYLNNLLKCRDILSKSIQRMLFYCTEVLLEAYSAIVTSSPLFLVHGTYHMIYARSNHRIVLELN